MARQKQAQDEVIVHETSDPRLTQLAAQCSSPEVEAEAYRQQIGMDVFHSLVHGIRIEMKPDQAPGSFADRVLAVHAELMLKAEQAGIIPAKS